MDWRGDGGRKPKLRIKKNIGGKLLSFFHLNADRLQEFLARRIFERSKSPLAIDSSRVMLKIEQTYVLSE